MRLGTRPGRLAGNRPSSPAVGTPSTDPQEGTVALTLLEGGRARGAPRHPHRVLHPRAALARRAGLEAVPVPADLWVAPGLLAAMAPERPRLRVVA